MIHHSIFILPYPTPSCTRYASKSARSKLPASTNINLYTEDMHQQIDNGGDAQQHYQARRTKKIRRERHLESRENPYVPLIRPIVVALVPSGETTDDLGIHESNASRRRSPIRLPPRRYYTAVRITDMRKVEGEQSRYALWSRKAEAVGGRAMKTELEDLSQHCPQRTPYLATIRVTNTSEGEGGEVWTGDTQGVGEIIHRNSTRGGNDEIGSGRIVSGDYRDPKRDDTHILHLPLSLLTLFRSAHIHIPHNQPPAPHSFTHTRTGEARRTPASPSPPHHEQPRTKLKLSPSRLLPRPPSSPYLLRSRS
ncbi:hypothetical protein R3P38DRAFT_3374273 [Favolaschia claudopus]|uniref:Uncharacterized protein n=1 Tax=Favolaschia claudopus TaxID=2862362 RepID=A0AAV9ZNM9_9AGAR